ncbi:MAG: hypothetical protein H7336_17015 [Bacteriovorax sp.]|nr:hypothetical protein [Bacteriovorax sp.]
MIAVGLIGGISLVLMQLTKTQSRTTVQAKVDADISQMKTEVQTLLTRANSCNANFANKVPGTTYNPTTLYDCVTTVAGTAGGCATGELGTLTVKPNLAGNLYITSSPVKTPYSDRFRVTGITVYIDPVVMGTSQRILTNANVTIDTQVKYLINPGEVLPAAKTNPSLKFYTTVIYDGVAGLVIGCPKTWNATTIK